MATLFTKIIRGELQAHIIAEDEKHIAFLDIRPIAKGHTLVVPKQEEDYFFALSPQAQDELMAFARSVAHHLEKSLPCQRIGLMVLGLEIPHVHIHLIPLDTLTPKDLALPTQQLSTTEMKNLAAQLKKSIQKITP